ncbi:MAG: ABC transporter ATP-binding protein [Phycisphaerales bacterium]|nr:MAG: ABC transporter ATP-binding protein [Phycisphaerales bacterium]
MSNAVEVTHLSFGYTSERMVLKDISFDVAGGEFVGIVGPNGAGKSTLLNLLCGRLASKSGAIKIDTMAVESYSRELLARKVAVVRQEFVPVFGFSVIEIVMMARTPYYGALGFESSSDREIVAEALQATGMAAFALRPLQSLSGGERQLVFIARALAQNSEILLLDEPTSLLDMKNQVRIYDLLKAAQFEKGRTVIAVTHDINLAAQYCDRILLLKTDGGSRYGRTHNILRADEIAGAFAVEVAVGRIGEREFFIPKGNFEGNRGRTGGSSGPV